MGPQMKVALGLPQIELMSADSTQRARLYLHNDGKIYVQKYDSVSDLWIAADIISDVIY
jgi:hypothetical protein